MDALELTHALEAQLGDPHDASLPFSYAQRVAEDEAEAFPTAALETLSRLRLQRHYLPTAYGGSLEGFEPLGAVMRTVAGRDLTLAIGHAVTFLGSMAVWLAGDESQQLELAGHLLAGERVSLALTEPGCGSDLLNMSLTAAPNEQGYRLLGEKWLVNGITHNRFVTVYARTSDRPGPRAFSLLLVDKKALTGVCQPQPKVRTLGVRGADISGLRFDAVVPFDALVGAEGQGFELTLKALQLSRTLCGSLALGALDTALDVTWRFAGQRIVYGKPVAALPQSQKLLTDAWARQLIGDSLTRLALRGLSAAPEQGSVHSAVVKYLVPTLAEQAIQLLSVVHGARHYLRDNDDHGIFQKMLRDQWLIGLFDGSTQVNLFALSHQLRALTAEDRPSDPPAWTQPDAPLPDFDWRRLALSSGGEDVLLGGFDAWASVLGDRLASRWGEEGLRWVGPPLAYLVGAKQSLVRDIRALPLATVAQGDPWGFELARRYAVLAAASAVLCDAAWAAAHPGQPLSQPAVLGVALKTLSTQLGDAAWLESACHAAAFTSLTEHQAQRPWASR